MEVIQQVRGDERSPEDLLHMALRRQHFEPIAAYVPDYRKRLQIGEDAGTALRATLKLP